MMASLAMPLFLTTVLGMFPDPCWIALVFGSMAAGYALMIGGVVYENARRKRRMPLRELPANVVQHPATVRLLREAGYGFDEGLVSFVDGWLLFSGRSLSFSVRREDVELDIDDGKTAFGFAGPHGTHRAAFVPLARGFREDWIAWVRDKAPVEGAPLYPPIAPAPDYRPNRLWLVSVALCLVMAALSFRALWPATVFHLGMAIALVLWNASRHRALARLRRGEPPRRGLPKAPAALPPGLEEI